MRRVQSIPLFLQGKRIPTLLGSGLRWIKPAGYAPHLYKSPEMDGERLLFRTKLAKGSKMALDDGGYLRAEDAYGGDDDRGGSEVLIEKAFKLA